MQLRNFGNRFENFSKEFRLLKAFYISELLISIGGGLIGGLVVIYFLAIGLTPLQVSLIISAAMLSFIFEIPTGAFADYYGRKASVLVAYFGIGVLYIIVPFFESFYLLLAIMFIAGVIHTFRSGAKDAWFIDFIKHNKKTNILQNALAKLQIISLLGAIPGAIVSSIILIYTATQGTPSVYTIKWLWIVSGFFALLSAFTYFFMGEEPYFKRQKIRIKEAIKKTFHDSVRGLKFSIGHEVIFFLIIANSLLAISGSVISIGWQQYLKQELGVHEMYFGFVSAFLSAVSILALLGVGKFVKKLRQENYALAVLGIMISICIFTQALINSIVVAMIAFGTMFVLFDFSLPIYQNYFNKFVRSKTRATIISVASMFTSLATVVGSLVFYGLVTQYFGIRTAYVVSAIVTLVSSLIYLAIKKK